MTDHPQSAQDAAVAAVHAAAAAGRLRTAFDVLTALDTYKRDLSSFDRHDFAYQAWKLATDDMQDTLTDENVVRLTARMSAHVAGDTLVDLIDIHFNEVEKRIRLDDAHGLVWLPDVGTLILSIPVQGGALVADVVLGHRLAESA